MSHENRMGPGRLSAARLSHIGLRVRDLGRMQDFYTTVLGLCLSDRGLSERRGQDMAFLTGNPAVHHQLSLVAGGEDEAPCRHLDHLSFAVDTLHDLRAVRDRAAAAGAGIRTSDHGNAWSLYVSDPEGNSVEVFVISPFQKQQPFGRPFDLDQTDAEIISATRQICDAR